jgi:hypothetical protein
MKENDSNIMTSSYRYSGTRRQLSATVEVGPGIDGSGWNRGCTGRHHLLQRQFTFTTTTFISDGRTPIVAVNRCALFTRQQVTSFLFIIIMTATQLTAAFLNFVVVFLVAKVQIKVQDGLRRCIHRTVARNGVHSGQDTGLARYVGGNHDKDSEKKGGDDGKSFHGDQRVLVLFLECSCAVEVRDKNESIFWSIAIIVNQK